MKKYLFALAVVLLVPAFAYGQPVINPTRAQFTASVDHNAVENEVAVVSNYELRIFPLNGTTPIRTLNLNKPTPDATNTIVVTITSTVSTLPVGDYIARVATRGPGGEAVSDLSNPFTVAVRPPTAATNLVITK